MNDVRKFVLKLWRSRWTPAVLVLAAVAGWYTIRHTAGKQTFELDGNMLVSGNPHLHEVCLTFDDGPHAADTPRLLDVLKHEGVRATFFVVGKMVDQRPDLVRRMLAEGHEVGNHTYTHKRLNQMPIASARQEIAACAASVKRATGADMNLMRPPGMEYNNNVLSLAQDLGYVTVHWNVVAADYVKIDPELIVKRVGEQTKDGAVILLHDSPDTVLALPGVIRELKARGYRFVTTTQMLSRLPRPVILASNAYTVPPTPALPIAKQESKAPRKKPILVMRKASEPPASKPSVRRPAPDAPSWDGSPKPSDNEKTPQQAT